jgi:hypothetical protein
LGGKGKEQGHKAGVGERGREMTQTLYAHMNKIKIKKKKKRSVCHPLEKKEKETK